MECVFGFYRPRIQKVSNNVVSFPNTLWSAPHDKEEVEKRIEEFKDAMLDVFLDDFIPFLLARINTYGIMLENQHDIALIALGIRSAIMRTHNRKHPLQTFAEETFTFEQEPEPTPSQT